MIWGRKGGGTSKSTVMPSYLTLGLWEGISMVEEGERRDRGDRKQWIREGAKCSGWMTAACNVLQLHCNTLLDPLLSSMWFHSGCNIPKYIMEKNAVYSGMFLSTNLSLFGEFCSTERRGDLQCCLRACKANWSLADATKRRIERKQSFLASHRKDWIKTTLSLIPSSIFIQTLHLALFFFTQCLHLGRYWAWF